CADTDRRPNRQMVEIAVPAVSQLSRASANDEARQQMLKNHRRARSAGPGLDPTICRFGKNERAARSPIDRIGEPVSGLANRQLTRRLAAASTAVYLRSARSSMKALDCSSPTFD